MNASDHDTLRAMYSDQINRLFGAAFEHNAFDAICALLRVGGMAGANWDPFEESRQAFEDYEWALHQTLEHLGDNAARRIALLMYCQAVEMTAPHEILLSLLRCTCGQPYVISPFHDLARTRKKSSFAVPPSATRKLRRIVETAANTPHAALAESIKSLFDENVRNAFSHSDYVLTDEHFRYAHGGTTRQRPLEELDQLVRSCLAFFSAFVALHRAWLLELRHAPRFHRWPNYEVLELLSTDDEGVYGFNIHFSNGHKATYTRRSSGIVARNILFQQGRVNFMVGFGNALEPIWKIDGVPVENWDNLP